MVTDDERRRVAAALRKVRVFTLEGRQEDGSVIGWQVALMSDLSKAAGVDDSVGFDTFARLADLIDPDATKATDSHPNSGTQEAPTSQVPECGRGALLVLTGQLDARATELLRLNDLDRSRKRRAVRLEHAADLMTASSRIARALGAAANGLPTSRAGGAVVGIGFELLAGGDGRPPGADAPEKN